MGERKKQQDHGGKVHIKGRTPIELKVLKNPSTPRKRERATQESERKEGTQTPLAERKFHEPYSSVSRATKRKDKKRNRNTKKQKGEGSALKLGRLTCSIRTPKPSTKQEGKAEKKKGETQGNFLQDERSTS